MKALASAKIKAILAGVLLLASAAFAMPGTACAFGLCAQKCAMHDQQPEPEAKCCASQDASDESGCECGVVTHDSSYAKPQAACSPDLPEAQGILAAEPLVLPAVATVENKPLSENQWPAGQCAHSSATSRAPPCGA